jgi:hypothetical protein
MYILVHTTYHWCTGNSSLGGDTCQFSVLVHKRYILVHTWYILVCTIYVLLHTSNSTYFVHTGMCWHKLSTHAFVPNHQHREGAYPHLQTCSPFPQRRRYRHDAAASGDPSASHVSVFSGVALFLRLGMMPTTREAAILPDTTELRL